MEIQHEINQDRLILKPQIDTLDAKEAPKFKEQAMQLVNQYHSKIIICDLQLISFIDSSGLGSLLSILRGAHSLGSEFQLSGVSPAVRSIFEVVKMDQIFKIVSNA